MTMVYSLYLFLVMLCTNWRAAFLPGDWGEKIRWADLSFLILLGLWLKTVFSEKTRSITPPFTLMLLLFLAVNGASILIAAHLGKALVQFTALLYLAALYTVLVYFLRSEELRTRLVRFWVYFHIGLCAVCLIAWFVVLTGVDLPELARIHKKYKSFMPFPRIFGLAFGPNTFAVELHTAIVLGLTLWIQSENEKKKQLVLLPGLLIMGAALILTVSRLMIGTLLSTIILLSTVNTGKVKIIRTFMKCIFFPFLFVIFILSIWVVFPVKIHRASDQHIEHTHIEYDRGWTPYMHQVYAGLKMLRSHPFLGVGIGNYQIESKDYLSHNHLDPLSIYETPKSLSKNPLHHSYMRPLAETGIIGFLCLCLLLVSFLKKSFQFKGQSVFGLGIWAGLAGFLVSGLFNDLIYDRSFWLFLAIGAACFSSQKASGSTLPRQK